MAYSFGSCALAPEGIARERLHPLSHGVLGCGGSARYGDGFEHQPQVLAVQSIHQIPEIDLDLLIEKRCGNLQQSVLAAREHGTLLQHEFVAERSLLEIDKAPHA